MDYIDLNDAYPKDSFPLLCIDQIVDASVGHMSHPDPLFDPNGKSEPSPGRETI